MRETKLRPYLLGLLSEEEQAHLELELLTDDGYYNQLLLAEEELSEAYLQDELSPHERQQFERVFLAHPERQENLNLLRALREEFAPQPPQQATIEPDRWERWRQGFGGWKWATAGLILLTLCFGATLLSPLLPWTSNSIPPASPVAASPSQHATPLPTQTPGGGTHVRPVELRSHQTMASGDEIPTLRVTGEDRQLSFRLGLERARTESYKVILESYDPLVREELPGEFKPQTEQGVRILVVAIPAARLQSDEYALRVEGITTTGTRERAGLFRFKVERK